MSPAPFTLTLILVRHGETLWNREGRFQGQTDVPLSPVGLEQAERVAERLAHGEWGKIDAVWSSDLARATQTAQAIVQRLPMLEGQNQPLAVERTPLLRERSFGSWEGLLLRDIHERFGRHAEPPQDAEPPQTVYERMNEALVQMWKQAQEQAGQEGRTTCTVIAVGHGAALKMLLVRALHAPVDVAARFRLDNTALCVLTFHGNEARTAQGRIERINDTAHLTHTPARTTEGEAAKPT